jgi:hypothetical protein
VSSKSDLQEYSNEQLNAELQRRVDLVPKVPPSTEPDNLSGLPPGSWVQTTDDNPGVGGTLASEYEAITRLAFTRMRELLAIPLDPADENYAASLRGINSAVGTLLTFISKANEELLRPPKDINLPKIIALINEEEKRLWEAKMPELVSELIKVSDEALEDLLTKRREHLNWREMQEKSWKSAGKA